MRIFLVLFLFNCNTIISQVISPSDFKIPFDSNKNRTATYSETIDIYTRLAEASPYLKLEEAGKTDSGKPLHVAIFSADKNFKPQPLDSDKTTLLIINAIHPGESVGVDASMLWLRDLLSDKEKIEKLKNLTVVLIPVYNISGALNRNSTTRTNQNGPESYGFRANIKNLDLNRDFIKADSKNAISYLQIFHKWKPQLMIDNHTTNGADYPYTMTYISSHKDKLAPDLSSILEKHLMPSLKEKMKYKNWEICPYVHAKETPDKGIYGFNDLPRYSSGFTTLFNCIGFTAEAHMLKSYEQRVKSCIAFTESISELAIEKGRDIKNAVRLSNQWIKGKISLDLSWKNTNIPDSILFKGYTAKHKKSEVSDIERLYYDQNDPFEMMIPYFNNFEPSITIKKPKYYIVPQAYQGVIDRFNVNKVEMKRLEKDSFILVNMYRITDFKTKNFPYENHYLHSEVKLKKEKHLHQYFKGDYIVKMGQNSDFYIMNCLEPQADDSFFNWNFFDGILMQKEYFSPYVFEDEAAKLLKKNPELRTELERAKKDDEILKKSAYKQLEFIYKRTPHYENSHNLYPVGFIN